MKTNWQTKKLSEVCTIVGGGTPKTGIFEYWDGDLCWVTPKDLGRLDGFEISETERKISEIGLKNSSAQKLPIGSVILSSRAPIGYVVINTVPMATNQGCRSFVCGAYIFNKYLYYFLISNTELLNSLGSGSTFLEVSGSRLKEIEIPLPSLETQKKIVEILDEKFAKIREAKSLREQSITDTEKILSQTLREIFEEGKEKGWEEDILNNVAAKVADGTHDTPKYQSKGFPLITSKNLLESGLDFSNIKYISEEDYIQIKQRSGVNKGDLLIAMIGTIGNITRVETEQKFSIKNVGLIKPDEDKVLGKYIMYFLHNSRLMSLIESKGATQKFIALGPIRNIKIKFPSLTEQKKIVERLDALSEKIRQMVDLQKSQLEDFKKLEKSYLREAFNGELI
ncbi:MAG: restriction endonuclease subunit S [Candidatus Nomurabacteria bacterium]|nr:restriction endonuclease subunit S [Candidatus Nomurabacteria bacterium]